jgi:hypothetical protein
MHKIQIILGPQKISLLKNGIIETEYIYKLLVMGHIVYFSTRPTAFLLEKDDGTIFSG